MEDQASKHAITNRNLEQFNSSALSPSHGRNTINYSAAMADDATTQDMTRMNAYKSAAKMRMGKKG